MVNGIWGVFTPPVERFFREMHQQILSIWFLVVLLKFYWLNFSSSCPGELPRDLFSTGGKRKYAIFQVFRAYFRVTSIVSHEIFMVARSHRVLAADIKSLLISALLSLETRLEVPILAILLQLLAFCKLSVLAQAFLGQWFFTKI